jgi:hypothetical protein
MLTLEVDISDGLGHVIQKYEKLAASRGSVTAVKTFKNLYDISLRISTSNKFSPIEFLKANKKGEPKLLGPLLKLLKGTLNERRAALSCLAVIKLVNTIDPDFKTESICKEPLVDRIPFGMPPEVGNYLTKYIKRYGSISKNGVDLYRLRRCYRDVVNGTFPESSLSSRLDKITQQSALHLTGRNGPNGPGLMTVISDHSALMPDGQGQNTELIDSIKAIAQITKNEELKELIEAFDNETRKCINAKGIEPVHSKLSLKREPWAKTRPFAICDYFSQSALLGFHNFLFSWLRKQKEDGTFRQEFVSEAIRGWTVKTRSNRKHRTESADLSDATNSIPVEIQGEVVRAIAGKDFAVNWLKVMTNRRFKLPTGDDISYNTGQPMGLLSSWAMLAVWHHITVRTCLLYLKKVRFNASPMYYVIGDDVSMKGTDLFNIYKEYVGTVQGVGISKVKGYHMETQTSDNPIPDIQVDFMHTAELAKRVFCNGQEITPVPPNEVLTAFEDSSQFPDLLSSLKKRGYPEILMEKLPALCTLSHDKHTALLLATNPMETLLYDYSDIGNIVDIGSDPWNKLPWFKSGFDKEQFELIFVEVLRERLLATSDSVTGNLTEWFELAEKEGEVKVKDWVYISEAQGLLIKKIAIKCITLLQSWYSDEVYQDMFLSFEGEIPYKQLKDYLGKLQVLFDIDTLFKEGNIARERKPREFANMLIGEVLSRSASISSEASLGINEVTLH